MQKKTSFFVWKPWHMVVLATVCGLAVGALTFVAQGLLPGTLNHFANSGAVWLAPAFFIAALMPGWKGAALVSTEMLLGEVLGYYGLAALVLGTGFGFFVALWTGTALVGGPLAGVAGFWWRHARFAWRVVAVAFLGGVFIAEGIFLLLVVQAPPEGWASVAIGVLIPLVLGRSGRERLFALAALPGVALLGVAAYLVINWFALLPAAVPGL